LALLSGPPLVAIGILGSRAVELVGGLVLVLAMLLFGALLVFDVGRVDRVARALFAVAAACLIGSMALAMAFVLGRFLAVDIVSLPTMALWHGSLNALGFAVPVAVGAARVSAPLGTRQPR
jgi:hypothetical protein